MHFKIPLLISNEAMTQLSEKQALLINLSSKTIQLRSKKTGKKNPRVKYKYHI